MAGNTTSLYSTSSSNGTTGSNNFTTLYPSQQGVIVPTTPYGNANVVALLNVGTDGSNTVANISATGNITANYFIGNGSQLTGVVAVSANTANTAVTVTGNAQPNITSVGTLTSLSSTGNVTGGNLRTAGAVSATGNVTANYFLGNGSQLTGLPATYSNANVATFLANFGSNTISTTGNVTTGNLKTNGTISATGNISTNGYFIGTFLGNIVGNLIVPGANTQVLYNNNGNADASAGFTFDSASNLVSVTGNIVTTNVNTNTVYHNTTGIAIQSNAWAQLQYSNSAAAPVDQTNIGTGSWFYVDPDGGVFQSNTTGTLHTVTLGNDGSVSAQGNITGNYFIGNGSQLTGIAASYGNANVANFLPTYGGTVLANLINFTNNSGIIEQGDQRITITGNAQGVNTGAYFNDTGEAAIFANSYVAIATNTIGNINPTWTFDAVGNLSAPGAISAVGNVTANYYFGNGSQLTGLPATYSNANVATFLANFGSNTISTTGNITASYLIGNGSLLTSITGANVSGTVANATYATTAGSAGTANTAVTVTGNAQANITSLGILTSLSVSGNTTSGNVLTSVVQATNSAGLSLKNASGTTQASMGAGGGDNFAINVSTNMNGNNAQIDISPTGTGHVHIKPTGTGAVEIAPTNTGSINNMIIGNVTPAAVSATTVSASGNVTGNYFIGNGSQLTGLPASYSNANVASFLANFGSNSISTTGNVTASYFTGNGSLLTSITGANVTGTVANAAYALNANAATYANVVTDAAQPNITSVGTLTSVSVSGNATVGNLLTGGIVSATGNITGNYFVGNGSQLTGIVATSNAAGANTQIQYNNGNAFAGNALMTFDNSTGNITLANVIIGTTGGGNATLGGNAQRINTSNAFSGILANATGFQTGQIIIGNGYFGNLNINQMSAGGVRGAKLLVWDSANVSDGSNVGFRYVNTGGMSQLIVGNVQPSNNTIIRGGAFNLALGGGTGANGIAITTQGLGVIAGLSGAAYVGQPNASIALGNTSLAAITGTIGQIISYAGSSIGNALGHHAQINSAGNITNGTGIQIQFTGNGNGNTPTNVYGLHMLSNVSTGTGSFTNSNYMRKATNYYFLRNDDAVAQTQLGTLRSYNEYNFINGTTSGALTIDKADAQVQQVNLTGTITGITYNNFVTSLSDSVNTDEEVDTVTIIFNQGTTGGYSVVFPTGSAYKYAGGVTALQSTAANSVTLVSVTATRISNVTTYLTTISPGFV